MSYPDDKVVDPKAVGRVSDIDDDKHAYSQDDGSSIVEGSEGVTQHELDTLRHVADRLPYAAWLVAVVEFAERWSYYATTNIYNNYIRAPLPRAPSMARSQLPVALLASPVLSERVYKRPSLSGHLILSGSISPHGLVDHR
ncbi:hypothetical protein BD779DRAFT_761522 [Infundibulicybe gibba]|nr:hypothetical protein BD779DRAFT_761522 [Infundibulicybe gibba]